MSDSLRCPQCGGARFTILVQDLVIYDAEKGVMEPDEKSSEEINTEGGIRCLGLGCNWMGTLNTEAPEWGPLEEAFMNGDVR